MRSNGGQKWWFCALHLSSKIEHSILSLRIILPKIVNKSTKNSKIDLHVVQKRHENKINPRRRPVFLSSLGDTQNSARKPKCTAHKEKAAAAMTVGIGHRPRGARPVYAQDTSCCCGKRATQCPGPARTLDPRGSPKRSTLLPKASKSRLLAACPPQLVVAIGGQHFFFKNLEKWIFGKKRSRGAERGSGRCCCCCCNYTPCVVLSSPYAA